MEEYIESLRKFLGNNRSYGRVFYIATKRIFKDIKRQSKIGGIV